MLVQFIIIFNKEETVKRKLLSLVDGILNRNFNLLNAISMKASIFFLTQYTLIPTTTKTKTKQAGPNNNYLPLYFFIKSDQIQRLKDLFILAFRYEPKNIKI